MSYLRIIFKKYSNYIQQIISYLYSHFNDAYIIESIDNSKFGGLMVYHLRTNDEVAGSKLGAIIFFSEVISDDCIPNIENALFF